MAAPPIQHLGVDIDTRRLVSLAPTYPFTAQGRGAAEILPQPLGGFQAQVAVGTVDEIHLRLGALDRLLIELVAIRLIGEGGGGWWGSHGLQGFESAREKRKPIYHIRACPAKTWRPVFPCRPAWMGPAKGPWALGHPGRLAPSRGFHYLAPSHRQGNASCHTACYLAGRVKFRRGVRAA